MSPLGIISLGAAAEMIGTPAATAWSGAVCAAAGMIALLLVPALRSRKNPEVDDFLDDPPAGQSEPVEASA